MNASLKPRDPKADLIGVTAMLVGLVASGSLIAEHPIVGSIVAASIILVVGAFA